MVNVRTSHISVTTNPNVNVLTMAMVVVIVEKRQVGRRQGTYATSPDLEQDRDPHSEGSLCRVDSRRAGLEIGPSVAKIDKIG